LDAILVHHSVIGSWLLVVGKDKYIALTNNKSPKTKNITTMG